MYEKSVSLGKCFPTHGAMFLLCCSFNCIQVIASNAHKKLFHALPRLGHGNELYKTHKTKTIQKKIGVMYFETWFAFGLTTCSDSLFRYTVISFLPERFIIWKPYAFSCRSFQVLSAQSKKKWAATWQNQQNGCAPSENSDQPGHQPSLFRVFPVRMTKAWLLIYPLSAQRRLIRLGGDWADMSLLWAHSHFVGFVMSRLKCSWVWATSWEKPVYAICKQQRRRWACASVQSDQRFFCSLPR